MKCKMYLDSSDSDTAYLVIDCGTPASLLPWYFSQRNSPREAQLKLFIEQRYPEMLIAVQSGLISSFEFEFI